ncbi:YybH family protein [Algihabitans albus]|uniref:YybH family protein n=1 Tax=Algihabitans albus TaxID=2164067 RepID=UPI000E5D398A|nr:nuclear transport factor 2 family protein [Algihabitans albus]
MEATDHKAGASAQDEAELRGILTDQTEALRQKDVEALVMHYAPGVLISDLAPPLTHRGIDSAGLTAWLETWDGPIGLDQRDLVFTLGDPLAFATSLNRMTGRKRDGEEVDVWFRATVCFEKSAGRWRVVHEHTSVPFHMDGSLRAAVDLMPPGPIPADAISTTSRGARA